MEKTPLLERQEVKEETEEDIKETMLIQKLKDKYHKNLKW